MPSSRCLAVLVLAFMPVIAACSQTAQPKLHLAPEVVMTLRSGGELRVKVELARTEAERQRGLMYREKLEAGTGMLFLFERPDKLRFWMKNTYIPLDMVFLDAARKVVFIEENAEPLTLTGRGPAENTQFVLEVPGGWARPHGIDTGLTAQFVGVE